MWKPLKICHFGSQIIRHTTVFLTAIIDLCRFVKVKKCCSINNKTAIHRQLSLEIRQNIADTKERLVARSTKAPEPLRD